MTNLSDNIFREYDIRGVFGTDLTEETAELIGRGYAVFLKKAVDSSGKGGKGRLRVSIGRDVRLSSAAFFYVTGRLL